MISHRILPVLILFVTITVARAEPSTQPTTKPAVSPAAQSTLDAIGKAYGDAKAFTLTGKISLDFDAGGEQKHESVDFTSRFAAPNQFRHEIKDDVLIVST